MKAIINANIFDFDNFHKNYYILFNKKIIEIGSMEKFPGASHVIDAHENFVMPGLVIGHTHIYSTFARGLSLPFNPTNFKDILNQLWWKLDSELGKTENYFSALVSGIEFIKNGITTVIDHHASGKQIKGSLNTLRKALCDEIGLRGIFCFETSDRFNVEECIQENLLFLNENNTDMYAGLFGLHASLSLSDGTLKKISELYKGPIHVHTAESIDDVEDSLSKYGMRVINRLNKFGLLRENSILAHCVHVTEEELKLISQNNCYIALNVSSNMNNGVGLPDYQKMKKHNVKTIIGNDGLGFNLARELLNLFFSMKLKGKSPLAFSLDDLKYSISNTYEIASKLLKIKLGKIQPGYVSDLIIVPYIPPTPISEENVYGHVVFGLLDNFRPSHVIVNGKLLMDNYKITVPTDDVNEIYKEARKVSQRLWENLSENYK
ncbi:MULTISPECIES: amidohydrolase family protein [unclassified Thermosipho (in: thermotogales)]|uniref:amidohydrolase family protein n=1 Tax=unclassified Thermosipho (in: thermotogales) TaxID=2676525 RepID=UPI00098659B6|nr:MULTISPECIES: amidohydrolase family protein [unclassified Thermosipho (in: thermotogales)]MBT1248583.1 amidohydrolase [Thermosipho sp. 1244]OOC47333.1 amidohydrolase [Thermosipho sp. 1223]